MKFTCPLCHQPVPATLYEKITGIWSERSKQLAKVKKERANLRNKFRLERIKLRKERVKLRSESKKLIQEAISRKTKRFESQLNTLKVKAKKIREESNLRIRQAVESEHRKLGKEAKRIARSQISKWKSDNRIFLREQIKKARDTARLHEKEKYHLARHKLNMTLQQMKTQDTKLRQSQARIKELERQLRKHTTPQMEGLLYEKTLIQELKKRFPQDKFVHEGKGGDVLHFIMNKNWKAGMIVYECKRVQHYFTKYVLQALAAQQQRQADYAVLVTNAMKKGTNGFCTEKGVLVVHATGVVSLASVLRAEIIRISEMKLGQEEKEKAVKLTLEYLQGPEFTNSMSAIVGETISLYEDLTDEMRRHVATWRKRYQSYSKIHEQALTVRNTTAEVLSGNEEYRNNRVESDYPQLIELASLQS